MKQYLFLVMFSCLILTGCSFTRYVDPKGRDCHRNMIYPLFPVVWETCDEKQEPLAVERHQIDANINQNTQVQSGK